MKIFRMLLVALAASISSASAGEVLWARSIAPDVVAVYGRGLTPRGFDPVSATMRAKKLDEVLEPFSVHHCRQFFQLWQCEETGPMSIESKGTRLDCSIDPFPCGPVLPLRNGGDAIITGPVNIVGASYSGRVTIRGHHVRMMDCRIDRGIMLDGCSDVQIVKCKVRGGRPVDATFLPVDRVSWYRCDFYCDDPQIGEVRRLIGPEGAVVNCRFYRCNRPLVVDEYTGPQWAQVVYGCWSDICPADDYRNERDGYLYHCSLVDRVSGVVAGSFARIDRKSCARYGTNQSRYMYAPGYFLCNRANGEWSRIVTLREIDGSLVIVLDRNMTATGFEPVELWIGGVRTMCAHLRNTSQGGNYGLTAAWGCSQEGVFFDNRFRWCPQPVQVQRKLKYYADNPNDKPWNLAWSDRLEFRDNEAQWSLSKEPIWYTEGLGNLPPIVGVEKF